MTYGIELEVIAVPVMSAALFHSIIKEASKKMTGEELILLINYYQDCVEVDIYNKDSNL